VRRGAGAVGSLARRQMASRPSRPVAEHRMRCPWEHVSVSSGRSARRGGPDVRMPVVPWSPCPHARSASTRPVSGVGVQCPRMRCPRPVSECPVSRVGVRAFRVGVRGVRSADFLERVGAGGRTAWRRSGSGPGSTAWPARDTPVARQDHLSVEEARPRPLHPICGMAGRKLSGQGCRHQADMTWAETEAATTSGLG
jgi:hypothetical protein